MALRRFYCEFQPEGEFPLRGDLFHHVRDVCRFGAGDRFELLPGDGTASLVEISRVDKKELWVRVQSRRQLPALAKPYIHLALSIPKLPKVDWIVEKSVELGVAEIHPFVSDFSFLRQTAELSENRLARWQKIVQSATQQSGRGDRLRLHGALQLEALLADYSNRPSAAGVFPYEGESELSLSAALAAARAKDPDELWLFVGSEGGFSPREVELFARHHLSPARMGEQILRVETACLALVSIARFVCGGIN